MQDQPPEITGTREGYDRWAEFYDEDPNPLVLIEEPHVRRVLGEVRGLDVVDVGCGTGRHAVRLAGEGARVTAVDFSAGMLAHARARPGAEAVRFLEHDLAQPLPFADAAFDRVLCCLVLDHIRDVDGFFRELRRVCRPDGFVLATVMHPAMMLRGVQARFRDPQSGREVRPESAPNQVSDYVMGATRAGLTFLVMSEHAVDEMLAARSRRAAKYLGWPVLLVMQLGIR